MVDGELPLYPLGLIKLSGLWKSDDEKLLEFVQEQDWLAMLSGEGRLTPPRSLEEAAAAAAAAGDDEEQEFCLERDKGLLKGEGEEGVEGVEGMFDDAKPSSFLALRITEWTSDSGPKAKRIISFSPWS